MFDTPSGSEARAAFRYPNFRFFMIARFVVVVSTEMQAVAVAWQIYALSHRPLDLGLVGLAQFLPGIFLFLAAGHTADRYPRQRIIGACYAASAVCSTLLLLLSARGLRSVWPIYTVLLLNGTIRAFNGPAGQAFLPLLVPASDFPNAVAWSSSTFQTATILGPAAGGLIYGFSGSPIPVYCCAGAGYLASLVALSRMRLALAVRPHQTVSLATVLEGLRFIWRTKLILGSISLDLFAVLLGGAVALLPVYAREILHAGAYGLGMLRSAPGAGAVLMALIVAHHPLRRRAGLAMLWCVAGFGASTIIFGLSRNLVVSLVALMLVGALDMISIIVRHTVVQLGTPDEMRGRVSAVNMIFVGASNEVGQFESGLTAQWFGTVPAVVLGGIGTILVVILWSWMFPALRKVDQLTPVATTGSAS
jgi:MFS family permease